MHVFTDPKNFDAYVSGFLWILKLTGASAATALVLGVLLAAMRVSPYPYCAASAQPGSTSSVTPRSPWSSSSATSACSSPSG